MGKSLIFSDLHLHNHKKNINRLNDCLQVLNWILSEAVNHNCKDILFLGDLFHERSKIDIMNYLKTFEVFMDFNFKHPEITIWLLVGNHDMYHKERWDINSIKPFTAIPNINIVEKPQTILIQNVKVDFLPHTENPIKELDKLREGRSKNDLQLLLGHLAVHGATLNTVYGTTADVIVEHDDVMQQIEPDVFDGWKQTFLGHYHGPQVLTASGSVEYVGSPLELSFGEAYQDKHIIIFDMDSFKKTYIDNTFSPKHLMVSSKEIDKAEIEKNFIKVLVDDMSSQELIDVRKKLNEKKAADIVFKSKEKKKKDTEVIENAKSILYKSDEMLEDYIKASSTGLDYNKLLKIGQKIIQKGAEIDG